MTKQSEDQDKAILSTSFHMAMNGSTPEEVKKTMMSLGWEKNESDFMVRHIYGFIKENNLEESVEPCPFALIGTLITYTALIYFFGDFFFAMPSMDLFLRRLLVAGGYAALPTVAFFILWGVISSLLGWVGQDTI